jgi:hypothetical protein
MGMLDKCFKIKKIKSPNKNKNLKIINVNKKLNRIKVKNKNNMFSKILLLLSKTLRKT